MAAHGGPPRLGQPRLAETHGRKATTRRAALRWPFERVRLVQLRAAVLLPVAVCGLLWTASCERDATAPHPPPPDLGIAARLPPQSLWEELNVPPSQGTTRAWLYRLGESESSAYLTRPHPVDSISVAEAMAESSADEAAIIFDLDSPLAITWWRVFLEHGPLWGQTTFSILPQQTKETVYVVLAPGAASRDRVIVYEGIAGTRPSFVSSDASGGDAAANAVLFPIGVENVTAIDGLELRFALAQAESAQVYLDPGSRLCATGTADDFRNVVQREDTLETGSTVFKLLTYPQFQQQSGAEIGAGSDILLYVVAHGEASATGLCIDPDGAFFSLQQGEVRIAVEVCNVTQCIFPRPCELTLTHPNGGERFTRGEEVAITWQGSEWCGQTMRIELLREDAVLAEIASSTDNDGTHPWVAEQSLYQVDGYRIRVTDLDSGRYDESDGAFWIGPIVVTPDGTGTFETIQAALDAAADGAVIELTSGTFGGPGNRELDFGGKRVSLISAADDPESCIIDCGGSEGTPHRALHFHSGEDAGTLVRGITLTGGYRSGGSLEATGGAILISGACSATIEKCTFSSNWAYSGGGACVYDAATPTFLECTFVSNNARDQGGGVCTFSAAPRFENCTFSSNGARHGGAVYAADSAATFSGCVFSGNAAGPWGGALLCSASSVSLIGCDLTGNSAERGAGIAALSGSVAAVESSVLRHNEASEEGAGSACLEATLRFSSCTFLENHAGRNGGAFIGWGADAEFIQCSFAMNTGGHSGAAIFLNHSDPPIENCVFIDNSAAGAPPECGGGAIRCDVSSPRLSNCTLYGNRASRGAGLDLNDHSLPTLANTIVSFGLEGEALFCGQTCQPQLTCCDLYGNQGGDWVGSIAGQYRIDGNISEDPRFCASAQGDLRLRADSPCAPFAMPNPECGLIGACPVGCAKQTGRRPDLRP